MPFAILLLIAQSIFEDLCAMLVLNLRRENPCIGRELGMNPPGLQHECNRRNIISHRPTWVGRSQGRKRTESCAQGLAYTLGVQSNKGTPVTRLLRAGEACDHSGSLIGLRIASRRAVSVSKKALYRTDAETTIRLRSSGIFTVDKEVYFKYVAQCGHYRKGAVLVRKLRKRAPSLESNRVSSPRVSSRGVDQPSNTSQSASVKS